MRKKAKKEDKNNREENLNQKERVRERQTKKRGGEEECLR